MFSLFRMSLVASERRSFAIDRETISYSPRPLGARPINLWIAKIRESLLAIT